MEILFKDIRYGFRSLLKRPGFTALAVITLALGIGANTAIFSVVNSVLLRPLPYPDSDRLVAIWSSPPSARNRWTSAYADYADWKAEAHHVEHLAVYNNDRTTLSRAEGPTPLFGLVSSFDLFPLLRVEPEFGRTFTAEEDRLGAAPVVVLSHDAWARHFNSDRRVIGSTTTLGDRNVTIIGVMPSGFKFPVDRAQVDYYMPLTPAAAEKVSRRSDMFLRCVARLKPDATLAQAQSDLTGIAARLARAYPNTNANRTVWINQLHEDLVGDTRPALLVLLGAVLLVLLIACANVANLLLAGATARRRETAVRSALGASRLRIATQLFTESAILATAGSLGGLLITAWLPRVFLSFQPASVAGLSGEIDARVLLFALIISVVVTMAAGIAPVLQSARVDLVEALKDGGRASSEGQGVRHTRSALVIAQVALSATLLVGAGLLVRSFIALRRVNPGFDPSGVSMATIAPSKSKFKSAEERNLYFASVLDRLAEAPGIESAASIAPIPFGGSESDTNFSIVGHAPAPQGLEPLADYRVASPGYFRVMGVPLLKGRVFANSDRPTSTPVVIVNEKFAQQFFPAGEPVGQWLVIGADPRDNPNPAPRQIVGVTANVSHSSLEAPPAAEFYVPMSQEKWPSMDFVVRARPGFNIAGVMRDAMRSADPTEYVAAPRPLGTLVDNSLKRHEFTLMLLGTFAGLALLLATMGVYGVMAYVVSRRTQEFGIRIALGAQVNDVLKLVLRSGMTLVLIGMVLGLLGSLVLTRVMSGLLFGVTAIDATTFICVSVVLTVAALLACYIPARRATKADPLVALRYE